MNRWIIAAAAAVTAAVVVTADWPTATPDAVVDWLILHAGWDGLDPTAPTVELAADYNLPGWYSTIGVARPPAFFVVQAAMMPSPEWATALVRTLAVAGAFTIGWVAADMWGLSDLWRLMFAAAALAVGFWSLAWGHPALIWGALVALTWWWASERDGWWCGVPLGVAASVQLWPAIVAVALARRRPRVAGGASAVAGMLTLAGLAAPGGLGLLNGAERAGGQRVDVRGGQQHLGDGGPGTRRCACGRAGGGRGYGGVAGGGASRRPAGCGGRGGGGCVGVADRVVQLPRVDCPAVAVLPASTCRGFLTAP